MTIENPRAGRQALIGLLAGLCWNLAAPQSPAQPPNPIDITVPPSETSAAAPEKPEGPQPFWAKVPDLRPYPRPGLFLLPPTGAGYYYGADALFGVQKDKAPFYPYNMEFYDNDFRYLDKTDGQPYDFFDDFKRIHLGSLFGSGNDDWLLSIGGEERLQFKNEVDSRLGAIDNNYQLLRSRVYTDLWYRDLFRVYVEYIDAESYNQNLPPLAIDVNHSDLLNAFADIKLAEIDDHPVYARLGRQELLYGSQRMISPLDWANTRRTFDGGKVFWHSDNLDADAFWVRPVVVDPTHFDAPDQSRQFAGFWTTYRPAKGQAIDAYYLYLDSDTAVAPTAGRVTGGRLGYEVNTVGSRYSGDHKVEGDCGSSPGSLLWDFEGAYQFGEYTNRTLSAGMATGGLGWSFASLPMQPQFWAYYDYASGTRDLSGTGDFDTFNQLFPFGHYYFGYLDEVGRENIHDLNFQAAVYPTKWITGLAQYHIFRLDQAGDALYGTPPGYPIMRRSVTGAAGTDVGDELDLLLSFQLDRHSNVLVGYSKMYEGDFIRETGPSVSPELFYVQYQFRW